ncbi:MAG: hypothetical protein JNN29_11465, partial [Chitinophagaceae bacterium]|nr:hypothetical protein [Chitinophagaceae bacterium]
MKRKMLLLWMGMMAGLVSWSQLLTWTPEFANGTGNITITVDATKGNQGLLGHTGAVYVHIGVITNLSTSSTDWKHAPFTWGTTPAGAQASAAGTNKWSYSITNINTFFNLAVGETINQIAILFRDGAGNKVQRNTDGGDMYVPLYDNSLAVRFNQPPFEPKYVRVLEPINKAVGESIDATAVASQSSDMKLFWNGTQVQAASGVTTISASPVITSAGTQELVAEAVAGAVT